MIVIDNRVGSKELARFIPGAQVQRLEYADIWFSGRGPKDKPVAIGIERKTITDFVNSMISGRLAAHQLPGLRKHFDYVYIVVEGYWRPHPKTGVLEIMKRGWKQYDCGQAYRASAVSNFINTLEVQGGVHCYKTLSEKETAQWIKALFDWWNNKKWEDHGSLHSFQAPPIESLFEPTVLEKICACLPGVGATRAREVAACFSSVEDLCAAPIGQFSEIPGIGPKTASSIWKTLRGLK